MRINEKNYVDRAERAILDLVKEAEQDRRVKGIVTTSKIRNLLAMTADIYNQVLEQSREKLDEEVIGRIEYLRVRVMYECGREPQVRRFVEKAELIEILREIGGSKKNYLLFSRYMEALVAFHKYHGGKDQ